MFQPVSKPRAPRTWLLIYTSVPGPGIVSYLACGAPGFACSLGRGKAGVVGVVGISGLSSQIGELTKDASVANMVPLVLARRS